ncbi:hypothetical protein QJQ45_012397 [Haematococcus lacustris]|nr:hypothetical protein QJQ45_012397 [Haematococcus lacustris]
MRGFGLPQEDGIVSAYFEAVRAYRSLQRALGPAAVATARQLSNSPLAGSKDAWVSAAAACGVKVELFVELASTRASLLHDLPYVKCCAQQEATTPWMAGAAASSRPAASALGQRARAERYRRVTATVAGAAGPAAVCHQQSQAAPAISNEVASAAPDSMHWGAATVLAPAEEQQSTSVVEGGTAPHLTCSAGLNTDAVSGWHPAGARLAEGPGLRGPGSKEPGGALDHGQEAQEQQVQQKQVVQAQQQQQQQQQQHGMVEHEPAPARSGGHPLLADPPARLRNAAMAAALYKQRLQPGQPHLTVPAPQGQAVAVDESLIPPDILAARSAATDVPRVELARFDVQAAARNSRADEELAALQLCPAPQLYAQAVSARLSTPPSHVSYTCHVTGLGPQTGYPQPASALGALRMQRPLELCSYESLEALPTVGKEYQQGYKRVSDRLPKGRQRLQRVTEYRRGIDGRAKQAVSLILLTH